ncbi:MAG: alanine--tRNA ligase-related protein [Acidimicrobiales bacterium]
MPYDPRSRVGAEVRTCRREAQRPRRHRARPATSRSSRCSATSASATTSKKRSLAWEFVTEVLGIDGDRLWILPHERQRGRGHLPGRRGRRAHDRIQRLDKDNYQEMGETGPCGPGSEIFFDYGPDLGPEGGPGHSPRGEHRYVEIWNLVFAQYFRGADGGAPPTCRPAASSTGAGMELSSRARRQLTLYSVADVLSVLVDEAQRVTGHRLGDPDHRRGAAAHGRPAHDDLPRVRRRDPVQRGPRLRAQRIIRRAHPLRPTSPASTASSSAR